MKKVIFASKLIKGIILLFLSFMILSCNQTLNDEKLREPCRNEELHSAVISKEVAILIAKGWISSDYDVTGYNEIVTENEMTWTVGFEFKPENRKWTGGQPTVEIDKKTGKVIRWYFPK